MLGVRNPTSGIQFILLWNTTKVCAATACAFSASSGQELFISFATIWQTMLYAVSVIVVPFTLTVNIWFARFPDGSLELVSSELEGSFELSGSELVGSELVGLLDSLDEVSELVLELVGLLDSLDEVSELVLELEGRIIISYDTVADVALELGEVELICDEVSDEVTVESVELVSELVGLLDSSDEVSELVSELVSEDVSELISELVSELVSDEVSELVCEEVSAELVSLETSSSV